LTLPQRRTRSILVDVIGNDVPDPESPAHSPAGAEDHAAGPNAAGVAPAEPDEGGYAMRVIRHRCGDQIADMVAPMSAFEAVLLAIESLQERIDEIEARTSAYGPAADYDADQCGPLQ
jgi:hypothetical protein